MAKLFKDKIIKAKLENYSIPEFEKKLEIAKGWLKAYTDKSLHAKTESQCEQAFNQSFFIDILGYNAFPSEIYTIDPKPYTETSGQKPDAILGYFEGNKKRVIAVVEIKDVNTPLDKSQKREGNLSPVQQAFKYKPQYKECDFVIATNFYEIRLLKDNQLDFESFNLEDLVDAKDDYYQFRKFYFLLNAANFIGKSGLTPTEKLLSEIRIEQEQLTKSFYKEYRELRRELIKNIVEKNKITKSNFYRLAVEKAQKIIDRVVFISFCEDLGLLPQDKLMEVVTHTERLGLTIPVWDILKSFFKAIDEGSPKLGIPNGYNGELFKPDAELEGLQIDDKICKKFVDFGKYDFGQDLTVNILGHIFEQSISDIEELKSVESLEEASQQISKRKKDGIFYTPDYIVDYIVKNSLGKYLQKKEQESLAKHGLNEDLSDAVYRKKAKKAYEEYREALNTVKVLDPACGSGAFLVKVFDYLMAENKRVAFLLGDLSERGEMDLFKSSMGGIRQILENNIYGVDLNPESVEITKLSLWLKSAQKGEKLVSLKNNIKCGNSLIDDPAIAGERAFKWEEEFADIMKNGGFDVVVGNPPYVRQELLNDFKEFFSQKYKVFNPSGDLFSYFYEKSITLLKKRGILGFISNTFDKTTSGVNLRTFLQNETSLEHYVDFTSMQLFEGATTYPIIFITSNEKSKADQTFEYTKMNNEEQKIIDIGQNSKSLMKQSNLAPGNWTFQSNGENALLNRICQHKTIREKYGKCFYGIKTGLNEAFIISAKERSQILNASPADGEMMKPCFEGKDLQKWSSVDSEKFIIFTKRGCDIEKYLGIKSWLLQFKEKLQPRNTPDLKTGRKPGPYKWFEIQDSVDYYKLFDAPKIVWSNLQNRNKFSIDKKGYYINAPGVILPVADEALLCILNSSLVWFFLKSICVVRNGGYIEVKPQYFEQIPMPKSLESEQTSTLKEAGRKIIDSTKHFQDTLQKATRILKHEFQLEKISQKLEKFYELDFDAFIKALGIKKLDLQKKSELLDFFGKNKQELLSLKAEIDKEDQAIDEMVFDLYGLTPEERQLVRKA